MAPSWRPFITRLPDRKSAAHVIAWPGHRPPCSCVIARLVTPHAPAIARAGQRALALVIAGSPMMPYCPLNNLMPTERTKP